MTKLTKKAYEVLVVWKVTKEEDKLKWDKAYEALRKLEATAKELKEADETQKNANETLKNAYEAHGDAEWTLEKSLETIPPLPMYKINSDLAILEWDLAVADCQKKENAKLETKAAHAKAEAILGKVLEKYKKGKLKWDKAYEALRKWETTAKEMEEAEEALEKANETLKNAYEAHGDAEWALENAL